MRSRPEGENLIQSWFDIVSCSHYFWNCIQINRKYQSLISLIRSKKEQTRSRSIIRKIHYTYHQGFFDKIIIQRSIFFPLLSACFPLWTKLWWFNTDKDHGNPDFYHPILTMEGCRAWYLVTNKVLNTQNWPDTAQTVREKVSKVGQQACQVGSIMFWFVLIWTLCERFQTTEPRLKV